MVHKHLYLIDGSGYIFRAYYAIRPLATSQGQPTNAIYGFTQMILKLQREASPDYWAIVFDSDKPTFRKEMYDKYKANRKEPPDDLIPQFEYFPKVVKALNIPMFLQHGYEADDIIATITEQAKEAGFTVTIISGDKDLMQLIGPQVNMWDTMKEKHYEKKDVIERYGVPPEKIADLFGLMGDSSDNIPGVPGIGPKTASQLIQKYGDLENLLKSTSQLTGKQRDNIEKFADLARLSKQLATLEASIPLVFDPKQFQHQPIDKEKCHQLFRELEFSRLLSELTPKESLSKAGYQLIQETDALRQLEIKISEKNQYVAVDLETNSLNVMKAQIVGISLSWEKGSAAYIPVAHQTGEQLPWREVEPFLKSLLEDPKIPKMGQNLKYDLAILHNAGFRFKNIAADTMIASYLLNPAGPHNLDDLAQQYLDHRTIHYEEVVGKGAKQKSFAEVDLATARDYASEDADCTWQLASIFIPKLKEEGLLKLFEELEMPLMQVLLKMELAGVMVDATLLKKLSKEFDQELEVLKKKIHKLATQPFNINSPKQLGEILFGILKLPGAKKTKTGYSTNQTVLESLAPQHPLPDLVLSYRSLSKLKSTYTDSLLELIHTDGRLHTSFNQTVAATGRLSSSDPNLQNIPIRSPEGRRIREAFVAPKGFVFLSADYSQIELRILAHYTEDVGLMEAFEKGEDIHQKTAEALGADRGVGKTINFATIYGQTPFGLAQQLKIDVGEAAKYIENYFKQYPNVKPFREKILEEAREKGFVATLFGRRRFLPDLLSRNIHVKQNAERMAFNTVFQGSAADIIKKAMIDIDRELPKISPRSKMILQVHDELVFEVPEEEVEAVVAFVKEKMENAYPLKVPIIVDCGFGENWAKAH